MRAVRFVLALILLSIALDALAASQTEAGTALYFREKQPGTDFFSTRMLVTPRYLRIDNGKDGGDFILLDRRAHTVYSVSDEDRMVLVVHAQPVTLSPPAHFVQSVKRGTGHYPPVAGRQLVHYRLFTNDTLCNDVYAADGLLPDALAALREFAQTMAGQQAASLRITPKDMQDPCEMTNDVFLPGRQYAYGFPVRLADKTGNVRELVNYKQNERFAPSLFVLPHDFRRYSPGDLGP